MRLDRGAGNFYVMKVSKATVAQINTVQDECLKAWIVSHHVSISSQISIYMSQYVYQEYIDHCLEIGKIYVDFVLNIPLYSPTMVR